MSYDEYGDEDHDMLLNDGEEDNTLQASGEWARRIRRSYLGVSSWARGPLLPSASSNHQWVASTKRIERLKFQRVIRIIFIGTR